VTRLGKLSENIVAFYARGMSTRDIKKTLKRMYDVDVSPDLVSRVTEGIVEELKEWQHRPLDEAWFLPVVANYV
jgi:putative transposase